MQHGKDPEEENASDGQSVIVIDIPVEEDTLLVTDEIQDELIVEDEVNTISAVVDEEEIDISLGPDIHTQHEHAIAIQDEEASSQQQQPSPQEEYELNFPLKQSQPRAATTFSIFQVPNHFSSNYIYSSKVHYLTDNLSGMLYLDVNNDGLRGSYTDSTLNAKEYDTGVGGVQSTLVHCQSNEIAMSGYPLESISDVSRPNRGEGVVTEARQSDRTDAGLYNFDLPIVEPGRYYIMYQAPHDYRMSGNVLPLAYEVTTDGGRKCIPKGGEGDGYLNEIYDKGDLDWSGYCARSIGCFEVAPKFDLKKSFTNLELLNDDDESKYEGSVESLVALPDKDTMNVGVSKEGWPLNTAQYADAEFTLRFPSPSSTSDEEGSAEDGSTSMSMEELKDMVVPEEFATSHVKKSLESMASLFATRGSGDFDIQGFDFISGNIHEKRSEESRRMLRRGLQRDREEDSRFISVTYTFTTRGKYSPPPFEQLGTIVSDSINADPVGLVKSLKDKDPVFEQADDTVNVRHLTLKKEEKSPSNPIGAVQVFSVAQSTDSGLASWATVPLILLSASIASLVGVLMFRRVLGTRQKQVTDDPLKMYMKSGSVGFMTSRRRSEDSDTKKKSRFRPRSSNSSESSFAADNTKEESSGGRSSRRQQRELS